MESYRVLDVLGDGGFARVFLGQHVEKGQFVALKVLKTGDGRRGYAKARISAEKEIAALQALHHPGIVKLIEALWNVPFQHQDVRVDKTLILVLEYVPRGELFDFLMHTGPFGEVVARSYLLQLTEALSACHRNGVTHRDLKPENLLLDNKFQLKIADFGLSHVKEGSGCKLMYDDLGTAAYKAPEVSMGRPYDESVDVFAAGIVLFVMIAGFPPFRSADRQDWWYDKIMTGRTDLFWKAHCRDATFSREARHLIERMLAYYPPDRITMAEVAQHAFMQGRTLSADELAAEMKNRFQLVQRTKKREKEAKQKIRLDHSISMCEPGSTRDLGLSLPSRPPQLDLGGLFTAPNKATVEPVAHVSLSRFPSQRLVPYTSFETSAPCSTVIQSLIQIATAARCKYTAQSDRIRIRTNLRTDGDPVVMDVRFYANDDTLVVVKRLSGSIFDFNAIYDELLVQLAHLFD